MGVDVVFKARPFVAIPADDYRELRDAFHAAFPDDTSDESYRYPYMRWDEFEDEPTVEIVCLNRYYGPGYERGHWPRIREMGDWLAVHLGELAELRYGGDTDDSWEALGQWGKVRAELDAHWERHGNEPYREFWRSRGYG